MCTTRLWRAGSAGRGVFLVLALGVMACGATAQPADWESVGQLIADRFPDVPHITTAELASTLADPDRQVVLLDARAPDEYAISHLEGARLVTSVDEATQIVQAASSDALGGGVLLGGVPVGGDGRPAQGPGRARCIQP